MRLECSYLFNKLARQANLFTHSLISKFMVGGFVVSYS